MWKGHLPVFTASKQMSGWARRVTIVGEVQGIEDEDERKEPPNCTHQREKQVFIPLELCLADYLQNLVPSCPSQNKHNLHSEQDRLQVQWSYFGLSDQKMIYTEMRRADLGSRHGNWFRVLNKERRENMTHCSWCNPQGPEKLYFKPYLKKRIFMEGEKEAAFSPQGRLYRCCHIPPRCLLESKATSIPLEILLALPSKYIQNLGSSSGKRNIRPTIKLGSTSRNEEHWKWNQARLAMNDSSKSLDAFISGYLAVWCRH
ncbi:uncharacterized protein LOC123379195 isoform X10 [Felis catus]|uniref:uncharacterized protein LOC123379195 isoform X10 n=1 Tax=Felis catus TaxID=9685 RepID=UPI001D1A11B4|nr:uncharacterized protein LOC123379195 isoform X10 [Felis catus]